MEFGHRAVVLGIAQRGSEEAAGQMEESRISAGYSKASLRGHPGRRSFGRHRTCREIRREGRYLVGVVLMSVETVLPARGQDIGTGGRYDAFRSCSRTRYY